ncbi:MAG: TetR/AcrR family transcriptional regulator [Buchananella hordeovulneris]|nr:TetR/AcrR family transcriptional regulator [Buchananella hordeovulneris]
MPKIIGSTLAEHRARTRDKLFAALASLLEQRGFDSITLAEIATEAGVGRTAVYNHFKDKDSLLLGFIAHETTTYVVRLRHALTGVEDPINQLRIYVQQQLSLRSAYHLAPGPDLRHVVDPGTYRRLAEHGHEVESILRDILVRSARAGLIPPPDLDTLVPLINSTLAARPATPGANRTRFVVGCLLFVMRAVGVETSRAEAVVRAHLQEIAAVAAQGGPLADAPANRCPVHHTA